MREQPPRSILDTFMQSGEPWQAVSRDALYGLVCAAAKSGVEFTEAMAIADLHYWIYKQQVKPYRYYAGRWNWTAKRVYTLFVSLGFYGKSEDAGSKREQTGANREQTGAKSGENKPAESDSGASREQTGANREQTGSSILEKRDTEKEKRESAEDRRAKAKPADLAEVITYFRQRQAPNPEHQAEAWWDCFEGRGWKVGKARTPMADWRATVRTWIRNEPNFSNGNGNGTLGIVNLRFHYLAIGRQIELTGDPFIIHFCPSVMSVLSWIAWRAASSLRPSLFSMRSASLDCSAHGMQVRIV